MSNGWVAVAQRCVCLLHPQSSTNSPTLQYTTRHLNAEPDPSISCLLLFSTVLQSYPFSLSFLSLIELGGMPSTNLVIALVFAAIFGTALIWLTLYYVHRYIHQQCLELNHWFHFTALREPERQPCCYDKEQGRSIRSKSRSRSARREKSRGRSQYAKARKRHEERSGERPQVRDVNMEWLGQRHKERARPLLPTSEFMQNQQHEQQFYPPSGWHGKALDGAHMAYPQMAGQGAQVLPFAVPAAVPQQSFPPKATAMPEATHYQRRYQQPCTETSSDTLKDSQPEKPPATPKSPLRHRPIVNEVDYIHVCDEYPPIVIEALKKAEEPFMSSSSSSSDTSATTQEVPRASIPRGTRRFADKPPLQFPQYSHIAARPWDVPTSYPRQWIDSRTDGWRGKAKSRYAPSVGLNGHRHITTDHRHQDPSNALPWSHVNAGEFRICPRLVR